MQTVSSDDEELDLKARLGLIGSDEEREKAIESLLDRFERPLMKYLADRFSDLTADDRASAVHDCFITIHEMACEGTLDVDKSLIGLLFTIAKRRGIDLRRRNSSRVVLDGELTEEVGDYLVGTETGRDWHLLVTLDKAVEVTEEFRKFVETLKGQQKRVASVLADFLPDMLSDSEIADEIYVRTKQKMTVMEVKGAKNALMAKFKNIMKSKI